MTSVELKSRSVVFDPEIDLEAVHELPGKAVMQNIARTLDEALKCSPLIQDSHGWCFYVHSDDGRKYLIELSYVATKGGSSNWVLSCCRCAELRAWEWFRAPAENLGQEQELLNRAAKLLVLQHGYEQGVV